MVDLPRSPLDRNVTPGPQSSVSGGEIRSAYSKLAAGLDEIGQTFEAAAVEQAQLEGQGAVYRDDKGNLKYDRRNPLSQAGRAFNRSAQTAFVAKVSMEARSAIMQIEAEAKGDIAGFDKTAALYHQNLLKGKDKLIRGALDLEIGGLISSTRNGMVAEQQKRDIETHKKTILASAELDSDDAANLARTGGTGTPEYAEKLDAIRTKYSEIVKNPLMGVSQEQADIAIRRMESAHLAESIVGQTETIYREKGLKAAEDFASKAFLDPSLALSPQERRAYQNVAEDALRSFKGDRKIELGEARDEARLLVDSFAAGLAVEDDDVYSVSQRLSEAGDPRGATRLLRQFGISKQLTAFKRLSDRDQARELGRGLSGGLDDYVERTIAAESGGDPNARNPLSSATGPGQFIDSTWLDLVKRHKPDLVAGKSDAELLALRRDPALSREMVRAYGIENGQVLQKAGLPATSANLHLTHFLGAGDAVKVLNAGPDTDMATLVSEKVMAANPFLRGVTAGDMQHWAGMKMSGGIDPLALKGMRTEVAADAKTLWDNMKQGLLKGDRLTVEDMGLLGEQLRLTGDKDFFDEVAGFLQKSGLIEFPTEGLAAMRESMAATEQGGIGADERDVYDAKRKIYDETVKGLNEDAISLASRRGVVPTIEPLQMGNPQALAVGLGERQRAARLTEQNYPDHGPVPALTADEISVVARILDTGNVETAAQLLGVMAQSLDERTFMATMAKVSEKTSPALAIAGGLYVRNADVAESIIRGSELLKKTPTLLPREEDENHVAADSALPYSAFGPGMDEARNGFMEAARARYADLSAAAGDTSGTYSEARMAQSVRDVTGGLVEHNGSMIFPPRHGMPQEEFDRMWAGLRERDVDGARTQSGTVITGHDIRQRGILRSIGEGRYLVQLPIGVARGPSGKSAPYVLSHTGAPFVLDFTPAAINQRNFEGEQKGQARIRQGPRNIRGALPQ